jgi:group I intron endonuclease
MKEYKVYILRLKESDIPRYVGITSGKLNTRLNNHLHDIKRESCKNLHKKNWISKYKDSIIIEQIDTATNVSGLKEKEIFYIKKFREEGIDLVNATDGGDGCYGFRHSVDTIEKIREFMFMRKHSEETKLKMKGRIPPNKGLKTGKPAWNRGVTCSEESKEKQRVKKIGKKDTIETRQKKSKSSKSYLRKIVIECLIDNNWIEFPSSKDASVKLGLNRVRIIDVCKGRRNHTGGYKFRYKNLI